MGGGMFRGDFGWEGGWRWERGGEGKGMRL